MPKHEAPLEELKKYIPEAAAEPVFNYLHHYKVHLTVTRERKSVWGDYRNGTSFQNHRISVNGNLNPYAFLITLLHELAHLVTFMQYGNRVQSHGREWKQVYSHILKDFMQLHIFPGDILKVLQQSVHNPAASSCADDQLIRVLKKYDNNEHEVKLVEQIKSGGHFVIKGGKVFKKGERVRKRYQCTELATGKTYLFSPVYEVKELPAD